MTVSFWGEGAPERISMTILRTASGEWLTTGFGGVEVYDLPGGFPQYAFSRWSLNRLRAWYHREIAERRKKGSAPFSEVIHTRKSL